MSPEHEASERLQAALDALAAGRPLAEVMAGLPPELQPLLETSSLLSGSRQAGELPSAGFVLGLEEQLRADLRLRPVPAAPASPEAASGGFLAGAPARIAALALITLGLAGGIALGGAERAMPGQALYPIKRGMEEARRVLQGDPAEAAAAGLDRGWQRLIEAEHLLDAARPDLQRLEQLLGEMAVCYLEALDLAAQADAPAIALRAEGESQVAELRLAQMLSSAPIELLPQIRRVRDALLAARQRLMATGPVPLVPIAGSGGELVNPPVGLTPVPGSPTAMPSPSETQGAATTQPTATRPMPTLPVAPSASPTIQGPATAPVRPTESPRPTDTRRPATEEPTPEQTALPPVVTQTPRPPDDPPTRAPEPTWTSEPRWPTETPESKPIKPTEEPPVDPTPDLTADGHRVPAAD